jgi:hypothetical protein
MRLNIHYMLERSLPLERSNGYRDALAQFVMIVEIHAKRFSTVRRSARDTIKEFAGLERLPRARTNLLVRGSVQRREQRFSGARVYSYR